MTIPAFSLVSTVYNEKNRLADTITDLENQSIKPSECIIVDAGSTDGTYESLQQWAASSAFPVIVLQKLRCNVAQGRNLAISLTKNDIIVSTDFGCRFHTDWLKSLINVLVNNKVDVVGGAFSVILDKHPSTVCKADFILSNEYKISFDKYFSASSRSIVYYKKVWEKLGGYCEWLTLAADDTIFWRMILNSNISYSFAQEPYVYWGRHKTYMAFGKEAYRYGLGDGEAKINYRNFLSHSLETSLRYLFFVFLLLSLFYLSAFSIFGILGFAGLRSYYYAFRRWKNSTYSNDLKVLLSSILLIETSRLYYLKGYLSGLLLATKEQKAGRIKLRFLNIT